MSVFNLHSVVTKSRFYNPRYFLLLFQCFASGMVLPLVLALIQVIFSQVKYPFLSEMGMLKCWGLLWKMSVLLWSPVIWFQIIFPSQFVFFIKFLKSCCCHYIFPLYSVLNMEEGFFHGSVPIILGRPFMKTTRTKIDVYAGTLSMEFGDIVVHFNILDAMKHPFLSDFAYLSFLMHWIWIWVWIWSCVCLK